MSAEPVRAPVPLALEDRRALLDFAERAPLLGRARRGLAEIPAALLEGRRGPAAVTRLCAIANQLHGRPDRSAHAVRQAEFERRQGARWQLFERWLAWAGVRRKRKRGQAGRVRRRRVPQLDPSPCPRRSVTSAPTSRSRASASTARTSSSASTRWRCAGITCCTARTRASARPCSRS
jgi:hypothetical protein